MTHEEFERHGRILVRLQALRSEELDAIELDFDRGRLTSAEYGVLRSRILSNPETTRPGAPFMLRTE